MPMISVYWAAGRRAYLADQDDTNDVTIVAPTTSRWAPTSAFWLEVNKVVASRPTAKDAYITLHPSWLDEAD